MGLENHDGCLLTLENKEYSKAIRPNAHPVGAANPQQATNH